MAIGSGLYVGSGLGTGPRDGLMTGIARHSVSLRLARTGVEVSVLALGLLLGGTAGVGTIAFAFGVGPLVQMTFPRLRVRDPCEPRAVPVHDAR